jgi:manganese-dependent inorganic pyrophosphatase
VEDLVYVMGHKNPDTDSICSAIAYSELKRKLGINSVPMRLGNINKETAFVLNYFEVQIPEYLYTVKAQVSDLCIDQAYSVAKETSIKTAWDIMKNNNIRTLPVVDNQDKLLGIISLSDIAQKYMDALDANIIAISKDGIQSIVETLNATLIYEIQEEYNFTGRVVVASEPNCIKQYVEEGDAVITGNRLDSQLEAISCGAKCLILTCGVEADKEISEKAKEKKCIVMVTQNDSIAAVRLINQSISVGDVMKSGSLIKFKPDDFIEDIRDTMLKTRYRSYPVIDSENMIKGFISRYHILNHNKKRVILLDHNEKSQSVDGIEEAEILEIVDHHRLGDIQTPNPISIKNEPVGSTATIIAMLYFEKGFRPSKKIAGILSSAILSDTLKLQSPTTTHIDKIMIEKLAGIAGIKDLDEFAHMMFKEGSSLDGWTPKDVFRQDYKEYTIDKYKIGISQICAMDRESLNEMKDKLIEYMLTIYNEKQYHLLMILLTDVIEQASEVLFVGEKKDIISNAFGVDINENHAYLPGIISRKKQVVPMLCNVIEKIN